MSYMKHTINKNYLDWWKLNFSSPCKYSMWIWFRRSITALLLTNDVKSRKYLSLFVKTQMDGSLYAVSIETVDKNRKQVNAIKASFFWAAGPYHRPHCLIKCSLPVCRSLVQSFRLPKSGGLKKIRWKRKKKPGKTMRFVFILSLLGLVNIWTRNLTFK